LNAAKSLAVEDRLGTLEAGKYADMLILGRNPLEAVSNIWTSREEVILNGVHL
jgi:imidazolonepropionase-like amidohydrolase